MLQIQNLFMACCCCCCCFSHSAYWLPTRKNYFVVVVSHIQRIGCQPEKTTLHGGQSCSWSAEQGKENKRKSLAAYPPRHPPHCSFGENKESKRYLKKNQNAPRPSAVVFFTLTDRASTIPSKSTGAPICNTVLQHFSCNMVDATRTIPPQETLF